MLKKRKVKSIKPEKRTRIGSVVFKLTIAVFMLVIMYILFFSGLLLVTRIGIAGLDKISPIEFQSRIDRELAGKYLGILPRNNLIIVYLTKDRLSRMLIYEYEEIRRIDMKVTFPDAFDVAVRERHLSIRLCASGKCFLVDETGVAYKESDMEENDAWPVITLTAIGNNQVSLGSSAIDQNDISYLNRFKKELKERMDIELGRDFETPNILSSDIRTNVPEGWRLLFSLDVPLEKEVETLEAVFKEKIKEQRADLEYIDIRSQNKVFYKLKDRPQEEQGNASSSEQSAPEDKQEEKKEKKKD